MVDEILVLGEVCMYVVYVGSPAPELYLPYPRDPEATQCNYNVVTRNMVRKKQEKYRLRPDLPHCTETIW